MPKTNRRGNSDNYYPRSDNHFLGKNPEEIEKAEEIDTDTEMETEEVELSVEIPEPVPEVKKEVNVPVVKSQKPNVFRCPVCGFADGRFKKSDLGRRVVCRNCSNHIVITY